MVTCICCHKPGQYSIQIANEHAHCTTLWLCHGCMQTVANAIRGVIQYLQSEKLEGVE